MGGCPVGGADLRSIPANTGGLINLDGAGLINLDGAGLINLDGAGLINLDGSGLINLDGAGYQPVSVRVVEQSDGRLSVPVSAPLIGAGGLNSPSAAGGEAARAGVRSGRWVGTSTSMDGATNYGPVTFRVGRGVVTDFRIEGVTVSGCGGYTSIVVPRLTIKGSSISGSYDPVPGVEDTITVKARARGGVIRGTFTEGPTCVGAGRFTAKPRP
jgi:hypothetical protein